MKTSINSAIESKNNILAPFAASFAGVMLALPFAAALISNNSAPVAAHASSGQQSAKTASVETDVCQAPTSATSDSGGSTSSGASLSGTTVHRAFHAYPSQSGSTNTSSTTNNNYGAQSSIGDSVVGVSTAINDLIDVGDVNTNILSNNNVPILSNNEDVLSNNNLLSNNLNNNSADIGLASILGL
jgi:hypothetical protein